MPTTITSLDGRPCVDLIDHKGQSWTYVITVERPAPDLTRFVLSCLGRLDDPVYTVRRRGEEWACDCPAWNYSRVHPRTCKHCRACQDLVPLLGLVEVAQAKAS